MLITQGAVALLRHGGVFGVAADFPVHVAASFHEAAVTHAVAASVAASVAVTVTVVVAMKSKHMHYLK